MEKVDTCSIDTIVGQHSNVCILNYNHVSSSSQQVLTVSFVNALIKVELTSSKSAIILRDSLDTAVHITYIYKNEKH